MTHSSLEELRERLLEKDREIVRLLSERASLSIQVGRMKGLQGAELYDPCQESKVYARLAQFNQGPLPNEALHEIFREIVSASRALQGPTEVACLGPIGSFTHLAALSHFGKAARYIQHDSICGVFDEVEKGAAQWGVVPVENSSEGSVKPTLERLISTPLKIRAEVFSRISHHLLSRSETVGEIRRVYSHPLALAQCRHWLRENLPGRLLVEVGSTAAAAEQVLKDDRGAAIGSTLAARTYGLKVLAEGIEDNPSNSTRFIVVGRGQTDPTGQDKTSIMFGTRHVPGALCRSLQPLAREEVNMLRIESYPMRDRVWEYLFFVDFEGHARDKRIERCLEEMEKETTFLKLLGSYPRGEAGR
jgi:chorismate mutase/prephenate dehydratase